MELALVIFSAISAILTATLVFISLQIQKSLNANAKKRTESDADTYKQLERLLQRNQAIEQKLVELADAQSKSIDKVYELLRGSSDLQVGKLQMVADKIEAMKNSLGESDAVINKQLERLLQKNQAIEQKLVELIGAQSKSIDKVYELLRGSGDMQVGKLQMVADKIEALKNSLEESVRF